MTTGCMFRFDFELCPFVLAEEAVGENRRLRQGYLDQSLRAVLDEWPSRTLPSRLKMNLAKLFSPLL